MCGPSQVQRCTVVKPLQWHGLRVGWALISRDISSLGPPALGRSTEFMHVIRQRRVSPSFDSGMPARDGMRRRRLTRDGVGPGGRSVDYRRPVSMASSQSVPVGGLSAQCRALCHATATDSLAASRACCRSNGD